MRTKSKSLKIPTETKRLLAGHSTSALWALIITEAGALAEANGIQLAGEEKRKRARFLYAAVLEARRRSGTYDARQQRLF
jgi:hypothetical protein